MNIAIGSAYRNSASRLSWCMERIDKLADALPAHGHRLVQVVSTWGDSVDNTGQRLQGWHDVLTGRHAGLQATLVPYHHGLQAWGSTEQPERLAALSRVGDQILENVGTGVDTDVHALWYVESDLRWEPETVLKLAERLAQPGVDVAAPLVFAGPHFYDVWGFRGLDGGRFAPFPPYHHSLLGVGLTEVASVGSALLMRAAVARRVRMAPLAYGLVGFCAAARDAGFRIWVDESAARVVHPA